jgi:hypothetical protein
MYLSGGSSTSTLGTSHEFRRGGDQVTLGYMTGNGYFYAYAHPTISDSRIKKDIEDIDDNAFDFGFGIEKNKEHKLNVKKVTNEVQVVNNSNKKVNNNSNFGKINEKENGELNLGDITIEEGANETEEFENKIFNNEA